MVMEFNPDGSIKVPGMFVKQPKSMNIRKDVVSEFAPKKCLLSIKGEKNYVLFVLSRFTCETPIKMIDNSDGIDIEIGSDFKRCSDCKNLTYKLSASVKGDCSIDLGTCTAKGSQQKFSDEDYFS
jgi:hypothetical protein